LREFSVSELADLLGQSRLRNAACGVTGLLVYAGGNFMQVLEGPEAAVEQTFARIQGDSRHKGLIVLLRCKVSDRYFAQWSMAFERIRAGEDLARIAGCADLQELRQTDLESSAYKLIRSFACNMMTAHPRPRTH
jgi:hypothetical protein